MCDKTVVSVWVLAARTRDRLECHNVVPCFKDHGLVGRAVRWQSFQVWPRRCGRGFRGMVRGHKSHINYGNWQVRAIRRYPSRRDCGERVGEHLEPGLINQGSRPRDAVQAQSAEWCISQLARLPWCVGGMSAQVLRRNALHQDSGWSMVSP
jgi:hypothetical protein